VMNAADLIADAQLAARDWFLQVGDDRLPGLPFRYARGGGTVRARGPRLGDANASWFGRAAQTPPALDPASIGTAYAIA
jgi:crotonobetainyl-CoA:carnitine CoA-transferase CaiB-like acyl-CoA transferase